MIEGLWIINHAGICVYNFETEVIKTTNAALFGGLISAIDTLAKQVGGNRLEITYMGDVTLYHAYRSSILFVLAVPSSDSQEKVKEIIQELMNQFFLRYEEIMWRTYMEKVINIELFTSFDENVQFFAKKPTVHRTESREDLANIFKGLVKKINQDI